MTMTPEQAARIIGRIVARYVRWKGGGVMKYEIRIFLAYAWAVFIGVVIGYLLWGIERWW